MDRRFNVDKTVLWTRKLDLLLPGEEYSRWCKLADTLHRLNLLEGVEL